MSLDRCLFAVQLASTAQRATVESRVDQLRRIYGLAGEVDVATAFVDPARVLLGVLRVGGPATLPAVASWGAELPPRFREPRQLVGCPPGELRALPGSFAAMAAADGRVVLATGSGGVQALFTAGGGPLSAWSSHALAASWLATGGAALDPEAVAELVCWEYVGGSRTLMHGTYAVPPASRIELDAAGVRTSSYLSLRERWAPIAAHDAYARAERHLLESLGAALAQAPQPVLGLTGGADSRTVAVALRELGIEGRAFTYVSDTGAAKDAAVGAAVAARLGMPHLISAMAFHGPGEWTRKAHGESVWADGAAPAGCAHVRWPRSLSHWITGVGAGAGRAFYYRWLGSPRPRPGARAMKRVLFADMELDLGGADPEVRRRLRDSALHRLAEAAASGHRGWSVLDVLYGEQRARRWARAMTPRIEGHYVAAFAAQPLMQALASLPLDDRLEDGFARTFIGRRMPELVPHRPARPDGTLPPLARRRAVNGARRARRALRLPPLGRQPEVRWYSREPWPERHDFVEWLADSVLASPLLEEAMGAGWQRETRANFLRGEPHAAYLASWAAGPVALAEALAEAAR